MKFYRIYIEITNVCGLSCSFCPTKSLPSNEMSLEFFESVIKDASKYTEEIALHVLGDPLTKSNLVEYLNILNKYNMKAMLTTSGYFLKKHSYDTLFHPSVKQINISLNSYNKNDSSISFDQYLKPIINLCKEKLIRQKDLFINLRVWNLDQLMSEKVFNEELFQKLSLAFNTSLDLEQIYINRPKSIRLDNKILIHFDNYFEWPSLNNEVYGDGTCQGLDSHIAILSNGKVVPCCLDCDGVIELGNLHYNKLEDILNTKRVKNMLEGFKSGKATEELCQKCSYKERFN